MAAFVTNANFLTRYDYRIVGQMLSDDGTQPSQAALLTNTNLTQLILDASGEVISWAGRGGIYSEADLNNLTGNSQAYLQKITSDLTFYHIVLRRGLEINDYPQAENAYEALKLLADGKQIFAIQPNIDDGVAQVTPISVTQIAQQNYLDYCVPGYFPTPRFTVGQQ